MSPGSHPRHHHVEPIPQSIKVSFHLAWPFSLGVIPGEGQGPAPVKLGASAPGEMPSLPRVELGGYRVSFLLLQGHPRHFGECCRTQMRKPHPDPNSEKPGNHSNDSPCLKICSLARDVALWPTQMLISSPALGLPSHTYSSDHGSSDPSRLSLPFLPPSRLPQALVFSLLLRVITLASQCLAILQELSFGAGLQRAKEQSFRNAAPTARVPLSRLHLPSS